MNNKFNINIYSNDSHFCLSLAKECNSYGFDLTFFNIKNMDGIIKDDKNLISVNIIDLSASNEVDPLKIGEKARLISNSPIFGVVNSSNKIIQKKAKNSGFDLVFTKKMLLRSIKEVVIHISDNEK